MTEFGRYLKQCPAALKDKTRTLSLLKDALKNDLPKFRVLQAAYELGILEAIQRSNPISTDDRLKITTGLVSQYAMLENAAKNAIDYWQSVLQIEAAIDNLLAQIKEIRNNVSLLQSIPGIGSHSAALLLGEIGDISLFKKPKQLAAYFGLDPTERQSGSFRGTKNKLSKRGSPYARAALHMGVVNSICKRGKDSAANPVLLSYYEKKCKNKPAKVAQAASMHKLVFIVFAVLRDQKPFELKTPEQHAVEQGFVKAA